MVDTEELIEEAKLRYVQDTSPGITRKKSGDTFQYFDPEGKKITDEKTLERIKSLVIPPAWEEVWICKSPNGHIQATGKDQRERKQYIYHQKWKEASQQKKYEHILDFVDVLPKIRDRIQKDLSLTNLTKEKILATVVWLLENTLIRVGNEEYAKENKSYGLTTLRNRHVEVDGSTITFQFKGKSGVYHDVNIKNRRVAKIIKICQDLPGQDLFEYKDDEGNLQTIGSDDINQYLKEITGKEISAKDFRTWAATNIAAQMLDKIGECTEEALLKKNCRDVVKTVARHLRNTPSVCQKYYIHPAIFSFYNQGYILSNLKNHKSYKKLKYIKNLDELENSVLGLIHTFRFL